MTRKFSQLTPTRELRRAEAGGLILTEFRQAPALSVPRHAHESATVLCVYRGRVADTFEGCAHECKTSSVLIRPAGEVHSHRYGEEGAHCLAVQIRRPNVESLGRSSRILERVAHLRDPGLFELALRLRGELRIMDEASPLAIESLVLEMLARAMRLDRRTKLSVPPRWLNEARELIHDQFARRLHLSDIARTVGVHPAHLAETFRMHFDCTIGEYVRRLRLQYAIQELTRTDKPLKAVALAAGFYDHSHLANLLKRHYGLTPTEMRVLSRSAESSPKIRNTSKPE